MSTPTDLIERVRARHQASRRLPPPDARRAIRQAAGLSQRTCAEHCGGVTQQTFARWEDGTRTPSTEHLIAYVELLDALADAVAA